MESGSQGRLTEEPEVAVVVPNKNDARFLRDCLRSILTQDYPHLRCIVMDGESTDESQDILRGFGDRLEWHSGRDSCAAQAINRGWRLTDAPILAWLNSDDLWAPDAVRRVVETFRMYPDADVVTGEIVEVGENGERLGQHKTGPFDFVRSVSRADHILNQPAVFMKRAALEKVDFLREIWLHDHDLWIRLGLSGAKFVYIDVTLAFGRIRPSNVGNDARICAPQRVRLIEDFFARDDVPNELRQLERRARSWAHARAAGMYFRRKSDYAKGMWSLVRAFRCDVTNVDIIAAAWRRARNKLPPVKTRIREAFSR